MYTEFVTGRSLMHMFSNLFHHVVVVVVVVEMSII